MKKQTGFTLLEIMVVVVLIAVLAAIGLPSYNDYIVRSRLGEAYANLSDMSTKLEQYFQDQRTYNGDAAALHRGRHRRQPPGGAEREVLHHRLLEPGRQHVHRHGDRQRREHHRLHLHGRPEWPEADHERAG